jgi:hypothetical protein
MLIIAWLVKRFAIIFEAQSLITVFTSALRRSPSGPETPVHPTQYIPYEIHVTTFVSTAYSAE